MKLRQKLNGIKALLTGRRNSPLMALNPKYALFDIGEGTYGSPQISFYDAGAKLRIGKYCSIAPGVNILLGGEHHYDWATNYPFSLMHQEAAQIAGYPHTKGDVTIGNDVWIGFDALVLSGVTIGDGAVIAARSLVSKDVEPFSIVAGVPAQTRRYRFDAEVIKALQEIAWWDWPPHELKAAWHMLQSPRIEEFIAKYR